MSETSSDRVVETLRNDILTGRYRAGDRLPSERDLVEQLGVNRGAVREGLRALSQLGIVEVARGGARVREIEHASLDIVRHILELDRLPDATLVDQVLEVHSHLFSACVEMASVRGTDEELAAVRGHLQALRDAALDPDAYLDRLHAMIDGLVEASHNFIFGLMRRGLQLHFWERLEGQTDVTVRMPPDVLAPLASRLDAALAARDAEAASRAVFELMDAHRERVVKLLSAEQTRQLAGGVGAHLHEVFQLRAATDQEDRP